MKIILFELQFGDDRSFKSLSVFLFDHDLSFRIHFLMSLIILFILMKDDSMLIGCIDQFDIWSQCGLLFQRILIRLLGLIAENLGPNVISEFVIKFLIHEDIFFFNWLKYKRLYLISSLFIIINHLYFILYSFYLQPSNHSLSQLSYHQLRLNS